MFDLSLPFNKNNTLFITTKKYLDKKPLLTDKPCPFDLGMYKNKSELFEKIINNKSDELRKIRQDDNKRVKLEKISQKRSEISNKGNCELFINIEKKQMFERSPEIEKKLLFRSSIKQNSPCKTFYNKKGSNKTLKIEPIQDTKPAPRQFNTYDTWKISQGLQVSTKVFVISGTYPDIRKALIQRGWHENPDTDSIYFDLKWTRNARVPLNLFEWQLVNHFPRNFELSAKWQLYENIKTANRVSKSNYLAFMPRSFRLDSKGSEDFLTSFQAIYAVSILTSFLESPSRHFIEHVIVSNNICKRWISEVEKQNGLSEGYSNIVMNIEWKILTCEDHSEVKNIFQRLMISYNIDILNCVKANLKKLEEVDPQFHLNGCKNIWIVKAGRKSRGRDIALFNDLNKLKIHTASHNAWVVQKYIENPLVVFNKKFDIRQWVLISNSDPLTVWIFKKCYLRFGLEDYSDENITNLLIHLTNNSITKKSSKFNFSEIKGCMWSIDQFKEYLCEEKGFDCWTSQIFPQIKKIVKYSLLAVGNLGRKNSFEILGYDFMIDQQLKPWLLEVNSSPAMDYSTDVTEVLVKEVLEDAIKVIVDYPEGIADTGNFELCYRAKSYIPFRKTIYF